MSESSGSMEHAGWPHPTEFAAPPSRTDLERWREADRAARPRRLDQLRERMAREGVDAQRIADHCAIPRALADFVVEQAAWPTGPESL